MLSPVEPARPSRHRTVPAVVVFQLRLFAMHPVVTMPAWVSILAPICAPPRLHGDTTDEIVAMIMQQPAELRNERRMEEIGNKLVKAARAALKRRADRQLK